MKFFDVLYSNYYLFQTKIISRGGKEPYAMTVFTLSLTETFYFSSIIIYNWKSCESPSRLIFVPPLLFFILMNYFFFNRNGRAREIVADKPRLWGSKMVSICVTILFGLFSLLFIWLALKLKGDNCP